MLPDGLPERYNLHFQETTVTQAHPTFHAPYSGRNSLSPDAEFATTVTSTLFGGLRTWKGAEVFLNPELSGGSGLGSTLGVAGFPNGEAFRVNNPVPAIYLARLFLRQTFELGGHRANGRRRAKSTRRNSQQPTRDARRREVLGERHLRQQRLLARPADSVLELVTHGFRIMGLPGRHSRLHLRCVARIRARGVRRSRSSS